MEILSMVDSQAPGKCGDFTVPAEISTLCDEMIQWINAGAIAAGEVGPHSVLSRNPGVLFALRAFVMGDHGNALNPSHIMILMEKVIQKHEIDYDRARKDYVLSRRELDVLKMICKGSSNREIAERLFISEDTVKGHLKKIMLKMGVKSRSEIIVGLSR